MNKIATLPFASAAFLTLLLAGCGGGPRPAADLPPLPTPREAPVRPVPQKPSPPVRHAAPLATAPAGPAEPLTVARIGSYMDSLEADLRHHVHGNGLIVTRQGDAITVVIPDSLVFSSDGSVAGDDVLEPLAAVLRGFVHASVAVNGFTDTTGSPERSLAVSQKRAQRIADALAHEGVPAARLTAQGFGKTHLRVATGDDKAEPRNRRIEIAIKARPG